MKRAWIVPAALGLALPAGALFAAEKCLQMIVHPARRSVDEVKLEDGGNRLLAGIEDYETRWTREPFTLERGGAVLQGEFILNPADDGERRRVAIISHGHTVNRWSSMKYGRLFYRAGFSLVVYDQRYFGQSTGDHCTLGQEESLDLAGIIRLARRRFGEDCLLALHGESMGAATALLALRYETPDLVVADCPFADSELLFGQWFRKNLHIPPGPVLALLELKAKLRFGYDVRGVSPIAAVRETDVPICLFHGRADELIPFSHSEQLCAACRNEKSELHLVEGAGHARSIAVDPAAYERTLRAFLKNCGAI
ncbi:MAG: alpha/beta hydrolase [Oscillospiraceae bacterium]|nr:alpha/beta hydrolase [Oscillospiraceae bacterium]